MQFQPIGQANPLPIENRRSRQKLVAVLVFITLSFFSLIYLKFGSLTFVVGCIVLLSAVAISTFSIQNTVILLFAYISFLPNAGWGSRYNFFKGLYIIEPIIIFLCLVLLTWYISERLHEKEYTKVKLSVLDWSIVVLLIVVFFAALRGAFENGNFTIIKTDALYLFFYVLFFLYTRSLKVSQIETCWNAFIIITFFVSIEFIMLSLSEGNLTSLLVKRITTQQPNLAQIGFPLLASYLFFKNSFQKRLVASLLILPIMPMVFFSQQRALWVGVFFSLFLLGGFAFLKDNLTLGRVFKFIVLSLLIMLIMLLIILAFDKYITGSILLTVFSRVQSLGTLAVDESLHIRLSEISRALEQWQSSIVNIFWGCGLGAKYNSIDAGRINTYAVDNSFALILWRLGIVGLSAFLLMLFMVIKNGLYIFKNASSEKHKQLSAALLSGLMGLILIGMTNYCLVRYRFIIIWSFVFATIEILKQKVQNETKNIDS